jgi:hypothetical protein
MLPSNLMNSRMANVTSRSLFPKPSSLRNRADSTPLPLRRLGMGKALPQLLTRPPSPLVEPSTGPGNFRRRAGGADYGSRDLELPSAQCANLVKAQGRCCGLGEMKDLHSSSSTDTGIVYSRILYPLQRYGCRISGFPERLK